MRLTSDQISGWRKPTAEERQLAVWQWEHGINTAFLRRLRTLGLVMSIFLAMALMGNVLIGFGEPETVAGAVMGLMLFLMLFVLMGTRLKRYRSVLSHLEHGDFTVIRVMAKSSYVYRGSRQYMGIVCAELPNGQEIESLCTPYVTAKKLRRKRRFPVSVIAARVEGEKDLLAFALDM